jgi:putative peptide zinc metalloprotease protein
LELSRSRPQLRSDLIFTPRPGGDHKVYLIEDRLYGRYYHIGYPEYVFISLLDGKTSIAEALSQSARILPNDALSEQEAMVIGEWLLANDLASTVASSQAARCAESVVNLQELRAWQRWNPLVIRIPFGSPDRILSRVAPWLRWFYSLPTVILFIWAILIAGYVIGSHADRFAASAEGLFSPQRWLWLVLCWLMLKFLHEFSHGVVCRLYGGTVRDTGILLILFTPVAYIDVTSSWRFRSKWQRIYTAAAGMYIELWIASLAAIFWSMTVPGVLNDIFFNLFIMSSLTTLIFNSNFLMRFDGYYILSDLLGMPNLCALSQQYWYYWGRSYLLGLPATCPVMSRGKKYFVCAYGLAAMVWRMIICLTILVTAAAWFGGVGLLLAPLALLTWWGRPLGSFLRLLLIGEKHAQPHRFRFLAIATSFSVLSVLLLIFLPWPFPAEFPAIVEFTDQCVVRAGSAGWVRELLVKPGQKVRAGEILLRLENVPLQQELADLDLEIEQSLIKSRFLEQKRELAACQAELKNIEALRKRRQEKGNEVEKLVVRAPIAGEVIARELDSLQDTYLSAGQEICILGDKERKEIRVSVAQNELETATASLNHTVRIHVFGTGRYTGTLAKITPRASEEPPHAALCATEGGPLSVKTKSDPPKNSKNSNAEYELLEPCFTATAQIDGDTGHILFAGQRATVAIPLHKQSLAVHLYYLSSQWLNRTWHNSEKRNAHSDRS